MAYIYAAGSKFQILFAQAQLDWNITFLFQNPTFCHSLSQKMWTTPSKTFWGSVVNPFSLGKIIVLPTVLIGDGIWVYRMFLLLIQIAYQFSCWSMKCLTIHQLKGNQNIMISYLTCLYPNSVLNNSFHDLELSLWG